MPPDKTESIGDPEATVDELDPDKVFELAADETARCILRTASEGPKAASDIADRCGVSPATVYRQVDTLRDHGLVSGDLRISTGGDHHEVFETTVEEICLQFDGGLIVDVRIDRDFVDKFAALWEDIEQSGTRFGWRASES